MRGDSILSQGVTGFLQFITGLGFLGAAVVIINLNRNLFNKTVRGGVRGHWVMFTILSLLPLLLLLYLFILLSERMQSPI